MMAAVGTRLLVLLSFGSLAWGLLAAPTAARCCPFCSQDKIPTLAGDYNQALMVLVGSFTNAKLAEGTTDFVIEKVLKSNAFLDGDKVRKVDGKKVITLPRYLPQAKSKFVIFCDVYKDMIDPYRGIEIQQGSDVVPYLTGAVKLKDQPLGARLRYSFDHLNSPDLEVAMDAYRDFARTDYKDYMAMARKLPADTLAGWLEDPKTPPYRYGLYSSLLGLCGKLEHGKILRAMIDDPEKRKGSGIDGMLVGYVALEPKEAWAYLTKLLKDDSQDFLMRYAGLRTIRFMWESRPDLVSKNDLVDGLALVLAHADMADFAIEDLRKWKRWEMSDKVLDLFGKKSHDVPVVKRAILRFALQCPSPRARTFVEQQRRRDPDWVKDTEELLKLESPPSPPNNK
jgi:hypothetical protein